MSEIETPPGPWHWKSSTSTVDAQAAAAMESSGEALVAADGTRCLWAERDDASVHAHPRVLDLVERAWVHEQLPYVLEMWDLFRESTTPVAQADFLLQFANALTHLRWDFTGEFEEPPDN